jgi:PhzF family phenazine biosynthesis protein
MAATTPNRRLFFWVDAFARSPFEGNPAAVCITDRELGADVEQGLASEFGVSETVFLWPIDSNYAIRWFTPTREVPLVGHATLAAAQTILRELEPGRSTVTFLSPLSGSLSARIDAGEISIELPADQDVAAPQDDRLSDALGERPSAVRLGRHIMAIFDDLDQVRRLRPDFEKLAKLDRPTIVATAPGVECDYVLRFFAPANGVPEDPVSGVAQCSLVPYWAHRLGRSDSLLSRQFSRRGGVMRCTSKEGRVVISGRCTILVRGTLDERLVSAKHGVTRMNLRPKSPLDG